MLFINSRQGTHTIFCCTIILKLHWKSLIQPFPQCSSYCKVWQNTLLTDLSILRTHFPHFPTEEEFSRSVLASVNVSDVTHNQFYVLSKFALTYPRLKAGGALLPDLIEFYQWIHGRLAYLVTKNYAQKHGLEEVISKADQKHYLFQLYDRVKGWCSITNTEVCVYIQACHMQPYYC